MHTCFVVILTKIVTTIRIVVFQPTQIVQINMCTRIIQSVASTAGNRTNLASVKLMVDSVTNVVRKTTMRIVVTILVRMTTKHLCTHSNTIMTIQTVSFFSVNEQSASKEWHAVLDIGGRGLRAKIDTGASCNVVSINDYDILSKAQPTQCMNKCHTKLMSYGGHNLSVKGKVTYTAEYKRKYYPIEFVIVNERAPALLGLDTSIELGLVKRVNQVEKEESVLDEFKYVFQGLGRLKQKHRLKPECEPVIHPARRVPYRLQEQFDKTLSDIESNKIITKVTEPTESVNPIVTVRKPSGALRICLDPLELNKAIRREHGAIGH